MKNFKVLLLAFLSVILTASNALAEQSELESEPFSDGELEQILAPIALYPDTVLSHILVAATYPLEVIQAERWTSKNPDLTGSDAVEAVEEQEWDPSVKALVAFPQVLQKLSENLDWTQKLGDAFLQDEKRLLASVQSLRQKAYRAGNLDKMEKMSVTHEDDSIVIEPREREIVYVPYYDTRVVYGPWYWSHYPPVYWGHSHYSHHHGPFYWGHSVHVGFSFYFSSFHWHNHHIIRIPRRHYHPGYYYDRRQIVRHEHARRWQHNPTHRRGVSYRSVTVRDRYHSDRASRQEIRQYREENRRGQNSQTSRTNRAPREDTRIATPRRIREELNDGRISVEERNTRPRGDDSYVPRARNNSGANRDNSNRNTKVPVKERPQRSEGSRGDGSQAPNQTVKTPRPKPPKEERSRSQDPKPPSSSRSNRSSREGASSRSNRSSSSSQRSSRSRSSESRSSNRSSGNRSSGNRSRKGRDN